LGKKREGGYLDRGKGRIKGARMRLKSQGKKGRMGLEAMNAVSKKFDLGLGCRERTFQDCRIQLDANMVGGAVLNSVGYERGGGCSPYFSSFGVIVGENRRVSWKKRGVSLVRKASWRRSQRGKKGFWQRLSLELH